MCQQLLEHLFGDELSIGRNFVRALRHELRAVDRTGNGHFDNGAVFPSAVFGNAAVDADRVAAHRLDLADVSEADCRHAVCGHIPFAHSKIPPAVHAGNTGKQNGHTANGFAQSPTFYGGSFAELDSNCSGGAARFLGLAVAGTLA